MRAELQKAIAPVLESHELCNNLDETFKTGFLAELSDRLTSDFFSRAFNWQQKQRKQKEIDEANRAAEAYQQRILENRNISMPDFKARIMVNLNRLVGERNPGKSFVLDNYCNNAFKYLLEYFHKSSQTALNRQKGICLLGAVGTGKSTLFAAFQDNPFSSFRTLKAQDVVEAYIQNSEAAIVQMLNAKPLAAEENAYGFSRYDILIEEVGREQLSVNAKGESFKNTPVNVIEKLFMELYDRPGIIVHMVSNAETPDKLATLYGEAAASRIYDMFNVITFDPNAPNRRYT